MITPAFGLTATERVLPKLALDFTTASLDNRVTFTRATDAVNPATYVNSAGHVTAATNNEPRFDYNPATLICKGLLIEESRTNTFTYSEQFNDVSWVKSNSSITADAAISPDNNLTADKFYENTANSTHTVTKNFSAITGTTYTASFFGKPDGRNAIYVAFSTSSLWGGTLPSAVVDLSTGVVSSVSANATVTTTLYGNGFYRVTITATCTSSGTSGLQVYLRNNANTYTGNGVSGIDIWGAQLEAGAFATSYIPTTSAALTRNADVATMTGTNFSDWFNASEGAFAYTWQSNGQTNGAQRFGMTVSDGTANNRIGSFVNSSTTQVTTQVTSAGTTVASLNNTVAATTGVVNKTCLAYKLDSFASSSNASNPATDTSGATPTGINQSIIGADVGSTGFLNGVMQKISYWPQRLTNAEVQAFSK